jgi:hypothetical protein
VHIIIISLVVVICPTKVFIAHFRLDSKRCSNILILLGIVAFIGVIVGCKFDSVDEYFIVMCDTTINSIVRRKKYNQMTRLRAWALPSSK